MRTAQKNPLLWLLLLLTAWACLAAPKTASWQNSDLESASGGLTLWEAAPRLGFGGLAEESASVPLVGANSVATNPLRAGQLYETEQLAAQGIPKNNTVFTPSVEQTQSAAFKVIVGDAKYTPQGKLQGTIFDGTQGGYLEIKNGTSTLNSTYQLRLQTYKSVVDDIPFTIQSTRPVNPTFQTYLDSWGVRVVKPQ